jgi:hypothetical protein
MKPRPLIAAGGAALLLAGGIAWMLFGSGDDPSEPGARDAAVDAPRVTAEGTADRSREPGGRSSPGGLRTVISGAAPTPRPGLRPGTGGTPPASGGSAPSGPESGEVHGRVVDPEGNPIAGAGVRLITDSPGAALPVRDSTSDAAGAFRFSNVRAGTWILDAGSPGRAQVSGMRVEVPRPEGVLVVLEPDRPILVRAVGGDDAPLPGVAITAREIGRGGPAPARSFRAVTGPAGEAELRGLPLDDEARFSIGASVRGMPPVTLERTVAELRAGPLEIRMDEGSPLGGIVMDADGSPLANVRLILVPEGGSQLGTTGRPILHSTAAGEFRFTGLPGGSYTLFADGGDRGRRKVPSIAVPAAAGGEPLRIRLAPLGSPEAEEAVAPLPTRSVRALQAGLRPGTGAIVGRIVTSGPPPMFSIGLIPAGAASAEAERTYRQTAKRAEFRCSSVPAGSYAVLAIVDGDVRGRVEGVTVTAGKDSEPVVISLE